MEHHVCRHDLLQRGAERLDQLGRKEADETDGVGEDDSAPVGEFRPTRRRIQGREQGVLHEDAGPGQGVEQRGFAGVGVAGDGDLGDGRGITLAALDVAGLLHPRDLPTQLRHVVADALTVRLDLRLTGTAQTHATVGPCPTAGLTGQCATPATHPGDEVLELGELDLRLALPGLGVLGEDVEDEHGPVDDLDVEEFLQGDHLTGTEFTVGDDGVRSGLDDHLAQLLDLAGTDVGAGIGLVATLVEHVDDLGAGGLGQSGELREPGLDLLDSSLGPHTDENDPFQA